MNLKNYLLPVVFMTFLPASGQNAWIHKNGHFYNVASAEFPCGLFREMDEEDEFRFSRRNPESLHPGLKSGEIIKQVLDSIIWELWDDSANHWVLDEKVAHRYDDRGNVIFFGYCQRDDVNAEYHCTVSEGTGYAYDAMGNLLQTGICRWNEDTGDWNFHPLKEYTYDSRGNKIQAISYTYPDSTGQSINYSKGAWSFDSLNNLSQKLTYQWNEETSLWVQTHGTRYYFEDSGNVTTIYRSDYHQDTATWEPDSRKRMNIYNYSGKMIQYIEMENKDTMWLEEWGYDSTGRLINHINYRWSWASSELEIDKKWEFSYDSNGNLIRYHYYHGWDKTLKVFKGQSKGYYSYDQAGKLINYYNSRWDYYATQQWVDDWKTGFVFDNYGNITESSGYSFDSSSGQWDLMGKSTYTYDIDYLYDEVVFPEYYSDLYYHYGESFLPRYSNIYQELAYALPPGDTLDIIRKSGTDLLVNNKLIASLWLWYGQQEDSIISSGRNGFFYSDLKNTEVAQFKIASTEIYPNPVSDYLKLRLPELNKSRLIEIYNLQGRKLLEKKIRSDESIYVGNLESGLYIYNLTIDGKRHNGKFLKE